MLSPAMQYPYIQAIAAEVSPSSLGFNLGSYPKSVMTLETL